MSIRNKIIGFITSASICAMLFPFNVFAAEKTWQEAYLEAMDNYSQNNKSSCECRLVYLDNDDIPEFYIGDPMECWFGGLYTYNNGDLVHLRDFAFRDFFSAYSEKNGIFRNNYHITRAGEIRGINFVKMEDCSLTVLDELSYDSVNDEYKVNGEVVSKEIYDNKISEYSFSHVTNSALSDGSTTDISSEYLTYDEMKQYLLDSAEGADSMEIEEDNDEEQNADSSEMSSKTDAAVAEAVSKAGKNAKSPDTSDNGIAFAFIGAAISAVVAAAFKKRNS